MGIPQSQAQELLRATGHRLDNAGNVVPIGPGDDTARPDPIPTPDGAVPASRKMNEVERRLGLLLEEKYQTSIIQPQFRVRVSTYDAPELVHYTADWVVWTPHDAKKDLATAWVCTLWEAKDKRRPFHSDELLRPKLVRQMNPWISAVFAAIWDGDIWTTTALA